MVEMLGVLAVIALLGGLGISLYRHTLNKHLADTLYNDIKTRLILSNERKGTIFSVEPGNESTFNLPITVARDTPVTGYNTVTVNRVKEDICEQLLKQEWPEDSRIYLNKVVYSSYNNKCPSEDSSFAVTAKSARKTDKQLAQLCQEDTQCGACERCGNSGECEEWCPEGQICYERGDEKSCVLGACENGLCCPIQLPTCQDTEVPEGTPSQCPCYVPQPEDFEGNQEGCTNAGYKYCTGSHYCVAAEADCPCAAHGDCKICNVATGTLTNKTNNMKCAYTENQVGYCSSGVCKTSSTMCFSYSDCPTGKYCRFVNRGGSEVQNLTTAVGDYVNFCVNIGSYQEVEVEGIGTLRVSEVTQSMNWWSAKSWCEHQTKQDGTRWHLIAIKDNPFQCYKSGTNTALTPSMQQYYCCAKGTSCNSTITNQSTRMQQLRTILSSSTAYYWTTTGLSNGTGRNALWIRNNGYQGTSALANGNSYQAICE